MTEVRPEAGSIVNEISSFISIGTTDARKRALDLSRKLTLALETPEDTASQISFIGPLTVLCAKLAIDINLFEIISKSEAPVTAAQLATESGGEALLIVRVLRLLSIISFVKEVEENTWIATPVTHAMTKPAIRGSHNHLWDMTFHAAAQLPEWVKQNNYTTVSSSGQNPLQYAFQTHLSSFEIWHSQPNTLDDFNNMMTGIRHSRPSWIQWFPVEAQVLKDYRPDTTLLVDIGGGWGHDLVAFRSKYADSATLVLEDLPHVLADAPELPSNIAKQAYNFFAAQQPVKGARAYFCHFIFHDWTDDQCLQILRHTASAMTPGYSKLLLNEYVVRNRGASLPHALMDINMLAITGGLERTERQWHELVEKAGLKISKIWLQEETEGILEIML